MQWSNKRGVGAMMMSAFMAVACGQPGEWESVEPLTGEELGTSVAALMASAGYDPVLKAPRCTEVASGCDTVSLVAGRGSVGPERNAPNTLGGACADESSGGYRSDESIERVKVYTADGSNLSPGKRVALEVDVWAWSGYTSDALDLYYAADANSPVWTYLTTMVPAGAGAQTLKATYTLPSGGSTQAVRAAFRYGGSAGACAPGAYNDRDDLAFAVETPAPVRLNTRFAGGMDFSLQLRPDGTVWSYGANDSGQLGAGLTDSRRLSPVQTTGLTQVKAVAAGVAHALALKQDGTVWSWGWNGEGQLGDGSTSNRAAPVQVSGLSDVVAISAHFRHSLALKRDGTVWAWGNNSYGTLGNATFVSSQVPVQVLSLLGVTDIAAAAYHSVALKQDGTVWAWGLNGDGQLGNVQTASSSTPVQVAGLSGVKAISAGYASTLALLQDKTVWAWGSNWRGELGDGTTTNRSTPVQVPGLTDVTTLAGGRGDSSVVSRGDGSVWAWGHNEFGQLGDGTQTDRHTPTKIPGFSNVVSISAGGYHTLAIKQDGSVWGWGGGYHGELGTGSSASSLVPVQAPGSISVQ